MVLPIFTEYPICSLGGDVDSIPDSCPVIEPDVVCLDPR